MLNLKLKRTKSLVNRFRTKRLNLKENVKSSKTKKLSSRKSKKRSKQVNRPIPKRMMNNRKIGFKLPRKSSPLMLKIRQRICLCLNSARRLICQPSGTLRNWRWRDYKSWQRSNVERWKNCETRTTDFRLK